MRHNITAVNKTKQHETKQNETKQNETKRNKTKRNETKRSETKRNKIKQNMWKCFNWESNVRLESLFAGAVRNRRGGASRSCYSNRRHPRPVRRQTVPVIPATHRTVSIAMVDRFYRYGRPFLSLWSTVSIAMVDRFYPIDIFCVVYAYYAVHMCAYEGATDCAYRVNSAGAPSSGAVGGPPSPAAAAQASVKWSPPCST
eukprot:COSAG06_NODE_2369_length_6995_cov_7.327001_1_plen_200_part_00